MPLEDEDRPDVCLVVPPFDAINFPALGPSVLAAACRARGLRTELLYGSMLLASRIGYEAYKAVCDSPMSLLLGEHLFLPHAYPETPERPLARPARLPKELRDLRDRLAPAIGPYQEALARRIVALNPRILGISSTFQQNLAAAGLALLVKQAAPHIVVVMGGANVAGPMGTGLAGVFPWIDHLFVGEADFEFPDFCERLVRDNVRPQERLVKCAPIDDFTRVFAPDFSDYFSALRQFQRDGLLPPELPEFLTMESSRGCWWGEKHHCTFCGLNGEGMEFRQKPAGRVLDEIRTLTSAWDAKRFFLADNIMPLGYFKTLLPALAAWPERPRLFYEVKANLRDEQIQAMAKAGIDAIQPGIESLSSNVLKLMRKGVSGLQNLSLLRSCKSMGTRVAWNYLYGLPGESLEDYESVLRLMPKIEHLQPPSGLNRIIVDRFSPYHNTPEQFGIESIAPVRGYEGLYPADAPLADIAYHFTGSYSTPLLEDKDTLARLQLAIGVWKHQWSRMDRLPALRVVDNGGGDLAIADTRRVAVAGLTVLPRRMFEVLKYFERPRPSEGLDGAMANDVRFLLERHFVVEHEGLLLAVVTRSHAPVRREALHPVAEAAA
ncbi:MAG: RiPP maturation radical SAM C-methyltransferase [Rhizomicrobium sp.]